MRARRQRGSAVVEFAFTGITLICVWIGVFWMSMGMWNFHTLQYASKVTAMYIATHGQLYINGGGTAIKVSDVANVLANQLVGITANSVNLTLVAGTVTHATCRLDNCESDTAQWPPSGSNTTGTDVKVTADYVFKAPFVMWAPGTGSASFANSYDLAGYSHEQILF
jgi:Flp pilus assembly protein TadG